jgi:hypothetical protein
MSVLQLHLIHDLTRNASSSYVMHAPAAPAYVRGQCVTQASLTQSSIDRSIDQLVN